MDIDEAANGKTLEMDAGMLKTHLLLHPGETIRTPRILLMNWKGDITDSQNTWRKLMLAHYSPKDLKGNPVLNPMCFCSGGGEPMLYKGLPAIVERLGRAKVKVASLTNGSNLQGDMADSFAEWGAWVRVSLDGWDDASYAAARQLHHRTRQSRPYCRDLPVAQTGRRQSRQAGRRGGGQ